MSATAADARRERGKLPAAASEQVSNEPEAPGAPPRFAAFPAVSSVRLAFILIFALGFIGCTRQYYRTSADKETYGVMAEKVAAVPNMEANLSIESKSIPSLEGYPVVDRAEEFLGPEAQSELGAAILGLEDALAIAFSNSRTYKTRKENLYLQGLQLTLARFESPLLWGGGKLDPQLKQRADELVVQIDALAGTPGELLAEHAEVAQAAEALADPTDRRPLSDRVTATGNLTGDVTALGSVDGDTEVSARATGFFTVQTLLRGGGRLAADVTLDFLQFVSGSRSFVSSSRVAATFTQPLLRGAGYRVALEGLKQSERDLLYELRSFTRFRKGYAIQVAAAYYGVLRQRDRVKNSFRGYQGARYAADRERAFADVGQRPVASLGRLKQDELSFQANWVSAIRSYKQSLDRFKIDFLGVAADAKIILDDHELEKLGIAHPDLSAEDAVQVAMVARLDLQTARDEYDDAERAVDVVANALKPGLDLVVGAQATSEPGDDRIYKLRFDEADWSAGLNFDLPLNQKVRRNNYRTSLILRERAVRQLELSKDEVKLGVLNDWRGLDEAKRNYEISLIGVELAQKRVEEQELRSELGLGVAQDLVDARNSLIDSLNARTDALVSHTIARLNFWHDMGILFIKDNGHWKDIRIAQTQ